jgi:hypothetical protein
LVRPVDYGGPAPLDGRNVSPSEDTDDPKRRIEVISAANEVPFLITARELRDRKVKRRRKHSAPANK